MAGRKDDGRLRCSFCGKPQDAVRKLIAGPGNGVYICDECIGVCSEIVNEEMDSQDIAEDNSDGIRMRLRKYFLLQCITIIRELWLRATA